MNKEGGGREEQENKVMYLYLKPNGIYAFKRKVPADVREAFPEASTGILWQSLGTRDHSEAVQLLPTKVAEFESRCTRFRAKVSGDDAKIRKAKLREGGTDKYLLPEHVPVIIERFHQSMLVMDDAERDELADLSAGDEDTASILLEQRRKLLQDQLIRYKRSAALRAFGVVEEVASELLHVDGLIAPPGSKAREMLLQGLLAREVLLLQEQLRRLDGDGTPTPGEDEYPLHPRALPTMRDAFVAWSKSQDSAKTVDTYDRFVAEFESVVGAIPLTGLVRDHVLEYRAWLETRDIRRETAKNRLRGLSTLFTFVQGDLSLPANPFDDVHLHGFSATESHDERRAYTVTELQQLFSSPLYAGEYLPDGQTREALYWAPLIATFTGARIEEIAQLRAHDVLLVQGVWAVRFWEGEQDQRLKTLSSFRHVPLHLELTRCGFVAYAQERQERPGAMLFPSLSNDNKYQQWSAALSKSFAYYCNRVGLSDPRLDFHSFRYVFRQQCTNCGIGSEVRDALTGHWTAGASAGRVYLRAEDRQYPFPALAAAIESFGYSGLDLSHLYSASSS